MNGNAIAQVEPLDAADGERRLALHHHERDDAQTMAEGPGDLIQAIAVRPAHRMRGEQEQELGITFIHNQIVQAFFNKGFPVVSGHEALFVKPDQVAARLQVIAQSARYGNMLVMAITDKQTVLGKLIGQYKASVLGTYPGLGILSQRLEAVRALELMFDSCRVKKIGLKPY